jgi:hypothetical protein
MLKKVEAALTETVLFGANYAPSELEIRIDLTTNWKPAMKYFEFADRCLTTASPLSFTSHSPSQNILKSLQK